MNNKYKTIKGKNVKGKNTKSSPANHLAVSIFPYTLLLLAYGFVTVLTPNLDTLDSNGPKFLSLAILNLVGFTFILSRKEFRRNNDLQWIFFRNPVGIVYSLFLVVALLSFVNALNLFESIINFSKLITLFTTAYVVSVILRVNKKSLTYLATALSLLLIFDSLTVFYNIMESVLAGKGPSIFEIKSVYSNKNILSASIFVKIPFALWLLTFEKKWLKVVGVVSLFCALLATLFMSTRAFYIGSIMLAIVYVLFKAIQYHRKQQKRKLITLLVSVSALIIAVFLIFNYTIKYIYPNTNKDAYTVDFFTRLKTIGGGEAGRFKAWNNSLKLIREHPVLGVGTGNWKVEVLKYENLTSPDYIYLYKGHNDFLETAAETGITGGILFVAIFILIGSNFILAFFRKGSTEESYKYLFLPAFGLFCYFFDAFFNFPADRPEICSLFALFVGAGTAFTSSPGPSPQGEGRIRRPASNLIILMFLILTAGAIYVFYENFISLKLQRIIKDEQIMGALTSPADKFLKEFPALPDINIQCEPIAVQKARYLFNENRFREIIDVLKYDKSSPYDTRPEFFLAVAYSKLNMPDSAIYYYNMVFRQKPIFANNITNMSIELEKKGKYQEGLDIINSYIEKANKAGLPLDAVVLKQKKNFEEKLMVKRVESLFVSAFAAYEKKDYKTAEKLFSEVIAKEPDLLLAYDYRSFCNFFNKNYQRSIEDINKVFTSGEQKSNLLNLRGVNYQMLGNLDAACADFDAAGKMGDKDGTNNYEKFCRKGK
ncbi:MAG: O-antigen ligase family protein [Bacteroidales bacterium]|nr:O-antigen ligase family protein [Bacteroidales bacterium]